MPLHVSVRVTGDVVSLSPVVTALQGQDNRVAAFETVIQRLTPGVVNIEKVVDADGTAVEFNVMRVDDSTCKLAIRFKEAFTRAMPVGEFLIQTNVEPEPLRIPYRVNRPGPQLRADPALPQKNPALP